MIEYFATDNTRTGVACGSYGKLTLDNAALGEIVVKSFKEMAPTCTVISTVPVNKAYKVRLYTSFGDINTPVWALVKEYDRSTPATTALIHLTTLEMHRFFYKVEIENLGGATLDFFFQLYCFEGADIPLRKY